MIRKFYNGLQLRQLMKDLRMKNPSSIKNQMLMFVQPNSKELLQRYMAHYPLCRQAQMELIARPDLLTVLAEYISRFPLSPEAQRELFTLPDSAVYLYTECHPMCKEAEELLYTMDDPEEAVSRYILRFPFESVAAKRKMFELEAAPHIVEAYVLGYPLDDEMSEAKVFALPNAERIFKICVERLYELQPQTQLELYKSKHIALLKQYAQAHDLCREVQQLLLASL
jgi:hypothetical protein